MYRKMSAQETTQLKRRFSSPVVPAASMKECPVCHARCFADMPVCYNCLHAFSDDEARILAFEDAAYGQGSVSHSGSNEPPMEEQVPVEVIASASAPADLSALYDLLPGVDGLSVSMEEPFISGSAEPDGNLLAEGTENADFAPVVETVVSDVVSADGTAAARGCCASGSKTLRADQLMQIVISIHVARDACKRRGAMSEEMDSAFE